MLIDNVESDESILAKIYDEKKQEYNKPEQRTVERLSFLTMDEANSVMANVKKSLTDFDKLISDRNLSDEDVIYGTFTEDQLLEGKKQVFDGNVEKIQN